MAYSEPWNIQKFGANYIPLRYFVVSFGNNSRLLLVFVKRSFLDHFRCLAGFRISSSVYKCYVTCKVILDSVSGIFRHIWALFKSIFTHIQNLLYAWYIRNPDIFKSSTIFRSMSDILQCLWKIVPGYNYFSRTLLLRPF